MTLLEIEAAASALPTDEKCQLVQFILHRQDNTQGTATQPKHGHSVLDVPSVCVAKSWCHLPRKMTILGEMLEGRVF